MSKDNYITEVPYMKCQALKNLKYAMISLTYIYLHIYAVHIRNSRIERNLNSMVLSDFSEYKLPGTCTWKLPSNTK